MKENKIKVYIKVDKNKCINNINSSIFLEDTKDWILIDEGFGDNYSHAQGNYLEKGLSDTQGRYNYKYLDNKIVENLENLDNNSTTTNIKSQQEFNTEIMIELAKIKSKIGVE